MRLSCTVAVAVALTVVACLGFTALLADTSWSRGSLVQFLATDKEGPRGGAATLARLPSLLLHWNNGTTGPQGLSQQHSPAPLQRHRSIVAPLTLGPGARLDPAGGPGDGSGSPADASGGVLSTMRCSRMEAWGDVCVYKDVCFGDGKLKFITANQDRVGLGARTYRRRVQVMQ